ncbi:MAG: hypothetical protein LBC27_07630 [Spirochaetaceae bacterium]|jgi:hypothetical protein|nr:hypothetical protein [Spirochaetaceae bacterium]
MELFFSRPEKRFRDRNGRFIAIAGLLTALLIAPPAFADEFTLQGAMETVLIPVQVQNEDDGDVYAETGLGIFGYSPYGGARFKLMSNASLDRIGMISYLRFYTSTAGGNRLDTIWLGIWVKPTDWLRFDVGSLEDWTLWGKFGQQPFAPYTQRSKDEDAIFTEFYYPSGALMTIRPNDNLFIGVGLPALNSKSADSSRPDSYNPSYIINAEAAEKAYERIQAAIGYRIDGVGLARFQYVGANPSASFGEDKDDVPGPDTISIGSSARLEGAFAYNGIPNFLIDAGFKIPIEFEQGGGKFLAPYQISAGFSVQPNNFKVLGRIDSKFGSVAKSKTIADSDIDYEFKYAPEFNFHLTPSYILDTVEIGLDCGFEWLGETSNNGVTLDGGTRGGIGVFARKNFGPGTYVIGGIGYHFGGTFNSKNLPDVFTIPIIFNYASPKASLLGN